MQFGVGLVALCFGGGPVMQAVALIIASFAGGIEAIFDRPALMLPPVVLAIPLVWGLIAGRAHDLGWPGWPFVVVYLLPAAPWLIVMDGAVSIAGGRLAGLTSVVPFAVLTPFVFVPVLLFWVAMIVLATRRGQAAQNMYGEAPAPGLWGDLPR
jgi:uncharacterized membrane protein YhaH (DUF805 family)